MGANHERYMPTERFGRRVSTWRARQGAATVTRLHPGLVEEVLNELAGAKEFVRSWRSSPWPPATTRQSCRRCQWIHLLEPNPKDSTLRLVLIVRPTPSIAIETKTRHYKDKRTLACPRVLGGRIDRDDRPPDGVSLPRLRTAGSESGTGKCKRYTPVKSRKARSSNRMTSGSLHSGSNAFLRKCFFGLRVDTGSDRVPPRTQPDPAKALFAKREGSNCGG